MKNILFITTLLLTSLVVQATRNIEYLDRGLVAVKTDAGVFLSWRVLGTDPTDIGFNIYRDGTKITSSPITKNSNMVDASGNTSSHYAVRSVVNGVEQNDECDANVWANQTKTLKLSRPTGSGCTYSPNDCSLGDVDNDGQWEIILKWDPSNAQDNSKSGATGNVYLDCYKLDGTRLWRIDLGQNIRAGAHYTQFLVGDYDGDGYAELTCKTAPGTKDGAGKYISKGPAASADHSKSYRNSSGYILEGPEYLTIFNGQTGREMATVEFIPTRGTVSSWGDKYGNRVDRFLATNAYLGNGDNPSMVFVRGYYTRMAVTAWDWNGSTLTRRWAYDTGNNNKEGYGQGNHNLSAGDVDGDGYDEIIHGSCAIDHNGKFMYRTGLGHGDAIHFGDINPDRPGLEVYCVHEDKSVAYGYELHDARTGEILWGKKTGTDNGRGMSADVDPNNRGWESWSGGNGNVLLANGNEGYSRNGLSQNFRLYWDGDLQDELMDGGFAGTDADYTITKWTGAGKSKVIYYLPGHSCNTTKRTPNLSADLIGDWREEVITHNGSDELYITTTVIPTDYKMYTLMHDPIYRNGISWQNTAYNQPPHLGFWLGSGNFPKPDIRMVNNNVILDPTLTKNGTGSSSQQVAVNANIVEYSFVWTNAITVNVTWEPYAPEGLQVNIDNASKRVTFSGASTVSGVYNYRVTTVSRASTQASKKGTLTFGDGTFPPATLQKQGGGSSSQNVALGVAIGAFNYQWNYAESVEVVWQPESPKGIEVKIDNTQKKVYFTGALTDASACGVTYSFTVRTTGNLSGNEVEMTGKIVATGTTRTFECTDTNGDWDNTAYWSDNTPATACDEAYIKTGEVNVKTDVRSTTYIEQGATFRIRDNVAVREIHFVGGQLKSYTSNPQFRLTAGELYFDSDTRLTVGSAEASEFLISGNILGEGNVEKKGIGTLVLNANADQMTGQWIVSEGKVSVTAVNGLGTKGAQVKRGTTLTIGATSQTEAVTVEAGAKLELNAELTVSYATVGGSEIEAGIYTSADFPDILSGDARLVVTMGSKQSGVEDNLISQAIVKVVPNPAVGHTTLLFGSQENMEVSIVLIGVDGRVCREEAVKAMQGENKTEIDLNGIARGIYYIQIISNKTVEVVKLVVE